MLEDDSVDPPRAARYRNWIMPILDPLFPVEMHRRNGKCELRNVNMSLQTRPLDFPFSVFCDFSWYRPTMMPSQLNNHF